MKIISTLVLSLVAVSAFANPKHKTTTTHETAAKTTTTTVAKKDCASMTDMKAKEACMKEEAAQPVTH